MVRHFAHGPRQRSRSPRRRCARAMSEVPSTTWHRPAVSATEDRQQRAQLASPALAKARHFSQLSAASAFDYRAGFQYIPGKPRQHRAGGSLSSARRRLQFADTYAALAHQSATAAPFLVRYGRRRFSARISIKCAPACLVVACHQLATTCRFGIYAHRHGILQMIGLPLILPLHTDNTFAYPAKSVSSNKA